jgi:rare lipoprotein A
MILRGPESAISRQILPGSAGPAGPRASLKAAETLVRWSLEPNGMRPAREGPEETAPGVPMPADRRLAASHPDPGRAWAGVLAALLAAVALGTTAARAETARTSLPAGYEPVGMASWYGGAHQGRRTAAGRRYRMEELTAAHRTLPLDTRLLVTNLANGRQVIVTVSDRGPARGGRLIDLSRAAAERLDMIRHGVALVRIEIAGTGKSG